VAPYAVFAALALVSWNRWIEPYIDTGRELMVPWRLAHGERLYRDVHFHHGPLGPYLAALTDGLAGASLPARTALHGVFALLHVAALGMLSRRMLTPWRAALATSIAIACAVFLRPGGWLFPFSFDTAIAVAALTWALVLASRESGAAADAVGGACILAALLARPELGLAGVAALGLAARGAPRRLVPLGVAPLAAAASGYFLLSAGIPRERLVADGWLRVIAPPAAFQNVYRAYAGLDRPGLRLAELALAATVLALVAALIVTASFAAARLPGSGSRAISLLATAVLAGAAAARLRPPEALAEQLALIPPLVRVIAPLVIAAAAVRLVLALLGRVPRGALAAVSDAVLWMAAVFAARLLLAAGYVGPYDAFFLPLPVVVAVAALFGLADRLAPVLGAELPRLTAAALGVFLAYRVAWTWGVYRGGAWDEVATPAGVLRLPGSIAGPTRDAIGWLERLPPESTLAGVPEAGFFNYTLGLRNPFWLEQFFPGHLDRVGEARAIALLDARPPDVLLRANVLAVGEGTRALGKDYLAAFDAALRARYRVAARFPAGARADARIGDPEFFVELSKRDPSGPGAAR
jgi:hypothetical protein